MDELTTKKIKDNMRMPFSTDAKIKEMLGQVTTGDYEEE